MKHEIEQGLHEKLCAYVLGEATYWQEALNGNDLSRLYGAAGVKGSVMFWNAWPEVRSQLLGLNGLAAPIFNHARDYVGAVAIGGSIQHVPASPPPEQIKAVTQTAQRISRKLGWSGR